MTMSGIVLQTRSNRFAVARFEYPTHVTGAQDVGDNGARESIIIDNEHIERAQAHFDPQR